MPPINQHRLLTEKELSGWLGVSLPTLQRLRSRGGGPRFVRISLRRVGYRTTDVEAWLEERTAERLDTQLSASALQEECAR
jgi:predicted DNA-binding transcriptional regulator AlpA